MRFFTSPNSKLIAMPPQDGCFMAWVHYNNDSIEREHIRPDCVWDLHEITEREARELDPYMFSECLERPYNDAPTMMQFYIDRANQYYVKPPQNQVEEYLIKGCGMTMSDPIKMALRAILIDRPKQFGIVAYGESMAFYIGPSDKNTSDYAEEKIADPTTHLAWWRHNTLEIHIAPAVFRERLENL